jgi:hypothetical protein
MYPALIITGSRQVGKTTVLRACSISGKILGEHGGLVANLHSQIRSLRSARDSGGAIAPTTIHTYRKATVFGRIGGMRSSHSAERWGRSDSGVPESPVFGAERQRCAQIPNYK